MGRYGAQLAAGLIGVAGVHAGQRAPRAAATDDGRRIGYSSPEELGGLFDACGLTHVDTGGLQVGAGYEGFDELWEPFTAGVGHSGTCCASLEQDRQGLLRSDLHRGLGSPEGGFRLTARAGWARGTVV